MPRDFGHNTLRVSPKLRMVCNCDTPVNVARSELSAALAPKTASVSRGVASRAIRDDNTVPVSRSQLTKKEDRKSLARFSDAIEANVFLTLDSDQPVEARDLAKGGKLKNFRQRGRFATATVRLDQVHELVKPGTGVTHIGLGEAVKCPEAPLGLSSTSISSSARKIAPAVRKSGRHRVLVGIIDVGGFDFAHEDFLDTRGRTRFLRIWDQGGSWRRSPRGFSYGSEFIREQLNAAMRTAGMIGVGAHDLERQSQRVRHSHGTHVASIAAGNSGVAPQCDIAAVLLSLPNSAMERRLSFYDSTRIAHAVDYLVEVADEEGYAAISINISLGTNGHAHDGSAPICRWLDTVLLHPGRSVCVSAGNAGQEAPRFDGDTGFIMGRIHTSGRIDATGLGHDLEWHVVGNGVKDVSENELEIWYHPQDRIAVQLKPPGMPWLKMVEPGEFLENQELSDRSFYSIYNELYHEANGANTISIYLSPFLSEEKVVGIPAGLWRVRLIGRDIRNGRFDGWIERDDPRPVGKQEQRQFWRFPSFFSGRSNVDDTSVNSLACANNVLAVGNLDAGRERIHKTSSQGPTRDGREKPDICAPGTDVLAASGFDGGTGYVQMTGTSMASPYATGVAALMLSHRPTLTAAQIRGVIQRTALPLPGLAYAWRNDVGFGAINPGDCVRETARVEGRKDLKP